ncbi:MULTISPECIES: hypothetical protein [Gordonia]|jgi:hypothetical protein|nr:MULTISPECIES: hypothetical protein [Gordonia]
MADIGPDTVIKDAIQQIGNAIFTGAGSSDAGNAGGTGSTGS